MIEKLRKTKAYIIKVTNKSYSGILVSIFEQISSQFF